VKYAWHTGIGLASRVTTVSFIVVATGAATTLPRGVSILTMVVERGAGVRSLEVMLDEQAEGCGGEHGRWNSRDTTVEQ